MLETNDFIYLFFYFFIFLAHLNQIKQVMGDIIRVTAESLHVTLELNQNTDRMSSDGTSNVLLNLKRLHVKARVDCH